MKNITLYLWPCLIVTMWTSQSSGAAQTSGVASILQPYIECDELAGAAITATAPMMLVDEGKVKLDDPAQKYFPTSSPMIMVPTPDGSHVELHTPNNSITLRNLLNHTSGLAFRSSLETPTLYAFRLRVRVESYSLEPLMFEPGGE